MKWKTTTSDGLKVLTSDCGDFGIQQNYPNEGGDPWQVSQWGKVYGGTSSLKKAKELAEFLKKTS